MDYFFRRHFPLFTTNSQPTHPARTLFKLFLHSAFYTAAVIWGVGTDEALGDAISVTIIATGFPKDDIEILDQPAVRNEENGLLLSAEEVVVKPELTPAEIEELMRTPAFERRRNVRIV